MEVLESVRDAIFKDLIAMTYYRPKKNSIEICILKEDYVLNSNIISLQLYKDIVENINECLSKLQKLGLNITINQQIKDLNAIFTINHSQEEVYTIFKLYGIL